MSQIAHRAGLVSFPAASGFTDPSDISDSVWFDFSDASSMTENDDSSVEDLDGIKSITDKGGAGISRVLSQSTSTFRPVWHSAGFARFDGANHYIINTDGDGFFGSSGSPLFDYDGWSVYAAVKANAGGTSRAVFLEGTGNPQAGWLSSSGDNQDLSVFVRNDAGTIIFHPTTIMGTDAFDDTLKVIGSSLEYLVGAGTGSVDVWIDDLTVENTSEDAEKTGTFTLSGGIGIGGSYSGGNKMAMDLYQLVFVPRALTTQEQSDLKDWMQTKVGL